MIQTVLGEITPENLGMTYMHEHLYADLSGKRQDPDSMLTDVYLAESELKEAVDFGVAAFVDVSCLGMGRNIRALQTLSKNLGVHVVCATGYYLPNYYPAYVLSESSGFLAKIMIDELTKGIDNTNIKAGIIGEIATTKDDFGPLQQKVFEAAAIAHKETGAAITTHCSFGAYALEQAAFLLGEGVPGSKIILGHMDLCQDLDYILEVLKTGVSIGFDTIGKDAYQSDAFRAAFLAKLCKEGYHRQIVLSEDISRRSYYKELGGQGYGYLMDTFLPMLKGHGISDETILAMLRDNPKTLLDIKNPAEAKEDDRIQSFIAHGIVAPEDVRLCNEYVAEVSKTHPIDQTNENYERLETHLLFCFKRIREKDPITEFPDHLKAEVEGTWFCDLAVKSFKSLCEKNNIPFVEAEAKYISVHLAVLCS